MAVKKSKTPAKLQVTARPIPLTQQRQVSLYLPEDLYEAISGVAADRHWSVAYTIREAIHQYCGDVEQ